MDRRLAVVAWTPSQRPHELAAALGGTAHTIYLHRLTHRALVPLRYALSALLTLAFLLRRRPRTIVVQNPPIVPAVLAGLYARATGAVLVLDSHPRGFGHKDSRAGQLFRPIHRRLMRAAAATMVASEPLAEEVRAAGGRPLILHEAPPLWTVDGPPPAGDPPMVLWVGVFAADEPIEVVVEAARRCPDVRFDLTGEPERCPQPVRDGAPPNVRFTGYRRGDDYAALLQAASVVLVLTTSDASVPRGAFEAVAAGRPLVASDLPRVRHQFPDAVLVSNDADGIVHGVREALARREQLHAGAAAARARQAEHWARQRDALLAAIDQAARPATLPAA